MGVAEQDALRREAIARLRLDLLGPAEETETFVEDRQTRSGESPLTRYLVGILYPANTPVAPEEDDDAGAGGTDDEDADGGVGGNALVRGMPKPSSIGLSFALSSDSTEFDVEFAYGLYTSTPLPPSPGTPASRGAQAVQWQRTQVRERRTIGTGGAHHASLPGGARTDWITRRDQDGAWSVSVFLRNCNPPASDHDHPEACLFQPSITVVGAGNTPAILDRSQRAARSTHDPDLESYRLLYRDRLEFAVGHGCAATWDAVEHIPPRVRSVRTELLPVADVPTTVARGGSALRLEMSMLGSAGAAELRPLLEPLLAEYSAWIDERGLEVAALPEDLRGKANEHLADCREALARMRAGINLLESDLAASSAFRFANKAMALQRQRAILVAARQRGEEPLPLEPPTWRPFQLAFLLLNLVGVADGTSRDRDLVDLLWFPTGGGKTEAYLGLAAFSMGLRRMRSMRAGPAAPRGDGGVSVLMRYTLRLLTIQQFQRAATLICACEYLRAVEPGALGTTPFSIGLWVGGASTPNRIKGPANPDLGLEAGAYEVLAAFDPQNEPATANPVQLRACPWCGAPLRHTDYSVHPELLHLQIRCPDSACDFHGAASDPYSGIPAYVVDEDLFLRCPTLVIATVDKFARIPWDDHTKALFGDVDRHCGRHGWLARGARYGDCGRSHRRRGAMPPTSLVPCARFLPPELIIQDELHLITGPLGSLVGLYETAVDLLAAHPAFGRPKVIASTATIRRYADQISGVFQRQARQFPPPGLDAGNSFFAAETNAQPGRLYVGICAQGRSLKTAAVRVFGSVLHSAHLAARTSAPADVDPLWTVVAYYNSLRELGGALRLVEDDIRQRLTLLATRDGTLPPRQPDVYPELTSRIAPRDVALLLRQMERRFGNADAIDVLLCTNMISVGVDIERFGLMLVTGQPKTSAEYIQATSRVGRKAPGLILTLYNWSRPRDLSHYEHFGFYHSMLYRHVEVTSVTPWSSRARDKGLHAVFVGLLRLLHPRLAENSGARNFDAADPLVAFVRDSLVARARATDPAEADAVERELRALIDEWAQRVRAHPTSLTYRRPPRAPDTPVTWLLEDAEHSGVRDAFPRGTLNSLREVEATASLYAISLRRAPGGGRP